MRLLIDIHVVHIGTELVLISLYRPNILSWNIIGNHGWSGQIRDLHIALEYLTVLLGGLPVLHSDEVHFLRGLVGNRVGFLRGTAEESDYLMLLNLTAFSNKGLFGVRIVLLCLLERLL